MGLLKLNIFDFFRSFFPFQLIVAHLKHNFAGLVIWLFFFFVITGFIGARFGLPILFFSPEYLGEISNWSFALLGFGFGGLMMAFHSYSYSKLGKRFPFLTFVKRPFLSFCKNNSIIPVVFFVLYLSKMIHYQWKEEYATVFSIFMYALFFLLGVILFVVFSLIYFFPISNRFSVGEKNYDEEHFLSDLLKNKEEKYHRFFAKTEQRYLYFGYGLKICLSRPISHIDDELVQKVLMKNRLNTSLFEFLTVALFVGLSWLPDNNFFELPAAMSIVLLATLCLMVYSILFTWFRKWTFIIIVFALLIMDFLSLKSNYFSYKNFAYGLDYSIDKKPNYSIQSIILNAEKESNKYLSPSFKNYIELLENWKKKTGETCPKLVIVNSSGGGLRSALWTFSVLQKSDFELKGLLRRHIHLFTGASGGLVGASYFRELCLREEQSEIEDFYSKEYYDKLSSDMLNKLAFSASTRDLFFRVSKFDYEGKKYSRDRGQAFEEQLHANTNYLMEHSLGYYEKYEKNADIPLMIFTPTIVNDGRRLLISSQSLCFLTAQPKMATTLFSAYENVDYQTFFNDVSPQNIRFSSVIRASATFPFVTPMVTLPTNPEIQLMDAGIRDNYGGKLTIELLYQLQDWIKENTSGVVVLQIRDTKKVLDNTKYGQVSLSNKLSMPFSNIYSNFPRTQDFDQEQLFKIAINQLPFDVDIVNFNLREKVNDQISLSWHLSTQEKNKIDNAFDSKLNQQALLELKKILISN